MLDKFIENVMEHSVALAVTAFAGGAISLAVVQTEVKAHESKLQHVVYQSEFKAVLDGQKQILDVIQKNQERLETRLNEGKK